MSGRDLWVGPVGGARPLSIKARVRRSCLEPSTSHLQSFPFAVILFYQGRSLIL